MSESFEDFIEIRNAEGMPTVRADANTADIRAGGEGTRGALLLANEEGRRRIHLDAGGGGLGDPEPTSTRVHINGTGGVIRLGGDGTHGELVIGNDREQARIRLDGFRAGVSLGGDGADGDLVVGNNEGQPRIRLNAVGGFFIADGTRVHVDGANGEIRLGDGTGTRVRVDGSNGDIQLGGHGAAGDLFLDNGDGQHRIHLDVGVGGAATPSTRVHIDGTNSEIRIGGDGVAGDVFVVNGDGEHRIHLDVGNEGDTSPSTRVHINGTSGEIRVGGDGAHGDVFVVNGEGQHRIHLSGSGANVRLGGHGADGDLLLFPSTATDVLDVSQATIHLDAQTGDIRLSGADCAEQFEVDSQATPDAGTVLVVTGSGKLVPCRQAHDKRVVGVVSGAGGLRPAVILNQQKRAQGHVPVALIGKVYCKVDASYGPIEVGDFLTTSATQGHAMKAADASTSFGSVIGKALGAINDGCGLIPILVALQ